MKRFWLKVALTITSMVIITGLLLVVTAILKQAVGDVGLLIGGFLLAANFGCHYGVIELLEENIQ
jgi:hypothetical protein